MSKKKVLVTGGTKGIGRAIVDLLAKSGYDVAFCARTKSDVDSCLFTLKEQFPSGNFLGGVVDVANKIEIVNLCERIQSDFGAIDILVNNAGVFLPGLLLEEEDGALEQQLQTNLLSAYHFSRQLAPAMIRIGSGDIVNMCSIAGMQAYPNGGSYSISKFALRGLSLVMREELKETGVRVTNLSPGATWSASWAGVDLPKDRLMPAADIAKSIKMAIELDRASVVEEIVLRPQKGDL